MHKKRLTGAYSTPKNPYLYLKGTDMDKRRERRGKTGKDRGERGGRGKRGRTRVRREGTEGEGGEIRRKAEREWEISPPRSFLKVGAYGPTHYSIMLSRVNTENRRNYNVVISYLVITMS